MVQPFQQEVFPCHAVDYVTRSFLVVVFAIEFFCSVVDSQYINETCVSLTLEREEPVYMFLTAYMVQRCCSPTNGRVFNPP